MATNGQLQYHPDSLGNRFPDFSHVGYGAGRAVIPEVSVVRTVSPSSGNETTNAGHAIDDGLRIQAVIDEVSSLATDASGFRGAILLKKGIYRIGGTLHIKTSGVVLRGDGESTIIIATGTARRNLIEVAGSGKPEKEDGSRTTITDAYVPVGASSFAVKEPARFKTGDRVMLLRPGTQQWIHDLRMDSIAVADSNTRQWEAGEFDLLFQRTITGIKGNIITIDNPVVMAIDKNHGGGMLYLYNYPGRISQVGIESLRLESEYRSDTDEQHALSAVSINRAEQAWVRNVRASFFVYSAVHIGALASNITVDHCRSLAPKSIITGGRRYAFNVDGQLNLVKNCFSSEGRHDYVTGARVCGPNVFYNCVAEKTHADTGPHHRWSAGTLYDNITTDGEINAQDRGNWGTGHGWSGVSQYFWNCRASRAAIQDPWVSGKNYVIGMHAKPFQGRLPGRIRSQWEGTGRPGLWPVSLYEAQVQASSIK